MSSLAQIDADVARQRASLLALLLQRNSLAPINKLPVEILSMIFEVTREMLHTSARDIYSARFSWSTIASVCHRWRVIAMDNPRFWSHISLHDPAFASELARRARNLPLSLTCPFDPFWAPKALPPAFMGFSDRFERLYLGYSEVVAPEISAHNLSLLFNDAYRLPRLRELTIESMVPSSFGGLLQASSYILPALKSLELRNVVVPYQPFITPQLTSLSLVLTWVAVPHQWITQLLRNTPLLELLQVSALLQYDPTVVGNQAPLSLPNLKSVSFQTSSTSDIGEFFTYIPLRSQTSVHFTTNARMGFNPLDLSPIHTLWLRHTNKAVFSPREIQIAFAFHLHAPVFRVSAHARSSKFTFAIPWVNGDDASYVALFEQQMAGVVKLVVGASGVPRTSRHLANLFPHCPNVKHLVLSRCHGAILPALAVDADGSLYLPELKRVDLHTCKLQIGENPSTVFKNMIVLLKERRRLQRRIRTVRIHQCEVTTAQIERLSKYVNVIWDEYTGNPPNGTQPAV
ncbi:hypothetical protein ONZ45_g2913 [Pleurotus djamor]|nr:hypothetical protein ONZ45_g2913 [Pleurotus djamor]